MIVLSDSIIQGRLSLFQFKFQNLHKIFYALLVKHCQEIIASFYTRLTNGPIEGTNNKIKVIKRTAYGFRNFFHFRIRILVSLKTSNLMIRELSKKRTRPKAKVA